MAELADEELSGVIPREVEQEDDSGWQDVGWYVDEKGYKHFGVIPKQQQTLINLKPKNIYNGRSSDPRYRW